VGFKSRTSLGKVDLKRSGQIAAIYRPDNIRQGVGIRAWLGEIFEVNFAG
jgi:hypothetical protein